MYLCNLLILMDTLVLEEYLFKIMWVRWDGLKNHLTEMCMMGRISQKSRVKVLDFLLAADNFWYGLMVEI